MIDWKGSNKARLVLLHCRWPGMPEIYSASEGAQCLRSTAESMFWILVPRDLASMLREVRLLMGLLFPVLVVNACSSHFEYLSIWHAVGRLVCELCMQSWSWYINSFSIYVARLAASETKTANPSDNWECLLRRPLPSHCCLPLLVHSLTAHRLAGFLLWRSWRFYGDPELTKSAPLL